MKRRVWVSMKKVIAINGSPRKNDSNINPANTHELLMHALNGAKSVGAEIEIFNLYDIPDWKGCRSCFVCKKEQNEICSINDDLHPILEKIVKCDALILGSPIYLADVSGCMRSFFERLVYPHVSYTNIQLKKNIKTLFIYTMNRTWESAQKDGYQEVFWKNQRFLERVFGPSDYFVAPETYQWNYNKIPCTKFDGKQRELRKKTVFPQECKKAYELGRNLVDNKFVVEQLSPSSHAR
jgi:multimeric flavodoxin WrbA